MHVIDMELAQRAEHRISPAQLLLAELVTLPLVALGSRLDAELDANPALELAEFASCDGCGIPLWRGRCAQCRVGPRAEHDPDAAMASIPAPINSRTHMLSEAVASLATSDRWIADYLLADVDHNGLMAEPLPTVAARLGCSVERVQQVVRVLRHAGSPGLCAPSLVERLQLQVNAVAVDTLIPDEVGALLQRGLEVLTTGRPEAARASGLTIGQVDSALAWLRTHLRADLLERDEPACAPTPVDVIVRLSAVGFVIETVAGPWSAVRVAPAYLALADDPRVRPDLLRATRFVEVLGRRDNILTLVCAAILHRQSAWISSGHSGLRPLSRREVAAELGVHESTISRAVAGKHMLLPSGATTTLATFFGADDGARECLREIVAGESAPRSDADLARALAVRGHVVARRTIAKYRAELGIPRLRNRGGEHDAKPHPTIR